MDAKSGNASPLSRIGPLAVAGIAAALGFIAVYGSFDRSDNDPPAKPATETTKPVKSDAAPGRLNHGAMTTFVYKTPPAEVPTFSFVDATGAMRKIEEFRGKTLLLNLWATWCAPCREEMPALDKLQEDMGSDSFEVLALAIDRGGIEGAKKFLDGINVKHLRVYADPTTKSSTALKAVGMPTTLLIDREGREVGRLPGPADWSAPEAKALIEASLR